jgi:hypothetical protein
MEFCMKKTALFLMMALILLILTACQPSPTIQTQSEPPTVPTPEPGSSSVAGRVLALADQSPMPDTIVRLAEVHRDGDQGAYVLDMAFSPGTRTDANGYFVFPSVEAREYVIIVGDVEWLYDVISEADGLPKVWQADPNQVLSTGDLLVELSN